MTISSASTEAKSDWGLHKIQIEYKNTLNMK